jgi:hypothetical protein
MTAAEKAAKVESAKKKHADELAALEAEKADDLTDAEKKLAADKKREAELAAQGAASPEQRRQQAVTVASEESVQSLRLELADTRKEIAALNASLPGRLGFGKRKIASTAGAAGAGTEKPAPTFASRFFGTGHN